jgi:hypothetical protein
MIREWNIIDRSNVSEALIQDHQRFLNMFNAKGGDGVAAELPQGWRPRRPTSDEARITRYPTFYHKITHFQLPGGTTVEVTLVITTRRKWEKKMEDKSGWSIFPIFHNWVAVMRLTV